MHTKRFYTLGLLRIFFKEPYIAKMQSLCHAIESFSFVNRLIQLINVRR